MNEARMKALRGKKIEHFTEDDFNYWDERHIYNDTEPQTRLNDPRRHHPERNQWQFPQQQQQPYHSHFYNPPMFHAPQFNYHACTWNDSPMYNTLPSFIPAAHAPARKVLNSLPMLAE